MYSILHICSYNRNYKRSYLWCLECYILNFKAKEDAIRSCHQTAVNTMDSSFFQRLLMMHGWLKRWLLKCLGWSSECWHRKSKRFDLQLFQRLFNVCEDPGEVNSSFNAALVSPPAVVCPATFIREWVIC